MTTKPSGFTEIYFDEPYSVTLFPNALDFAPTPGMAIGIERCNVFGTERLIVRYNTPPIRKSTGEASYWPNGIVYVVERYVDGWKK